MRAYARTERELAPGGDPYVAGIRAQHEYAAMSPAERPVEMPLPYLYPPITLQLLRALGWFGLPFGFWACAYWVMYAAGVLGQMYVGLQAAEREERTGFLLLAPLLIYLPGLMNHDNILGGNISFIVYGFVLVTALAGWRRGRWGWFYVVVLVASCFKVPWLTLLAMPVLSARRQWAPASATAATGVGFLALQWLLWPTSFHHWLEAVGDQFSYNGFGLSPAGVLANFLFHRGVPYRVPSEVFFVVYAAVVAGFLLRLSRQYQRREVPFERWMPVTLLGVFLLNQRIKDYDMHPLTIAMALIFWRATASLTMAARVVCCCGVMAAANIIAVSFDPIPETWNAMACVLLVVAFGVGCAVNDSSMTVLPDGLPAREAVTS